MISEANIISVRLSGVLKTLRLKEFVRYAVKVFCMLSQIIAKCYLSAIHLICRCES